MHSVLTPHQEWENRTFPFSVYMRDVTTGIVCCAIPKSGCSTIKRWIVQRLDEGLAKNEHADIHKFCRDTCSLALHDPAEAERIHGASFSMVFVRDPLSRLASAYVDKFIGPRAHELVEGSMAAIEAVAQRKGVEIEHDTFIQRPEGGGATTLAACSRVDYERGISFGEFVEYVEQTPDEHLDFHWRPQCTFLGDRAFDLTARIDALTDILADISSRLGLAPAFKPRVNPTLYTEDILESSISEMPAIDLRKRWIRPRGDELFTPELRERVLKRYATDQLLYESSGMALDRSHYEKLLAVRAAAQAAMGMVTAQSK